jgi:hypothetical protein
LSCSLVVMITTIQQGTVQYVSWVSVSQWVALDRLVDLIRICGVSSLAGVGARVSERQPWLTLSVECMCGVEKCCVTKDTQWLEGFWNAIEHENGCAVTSYLGGTYIAYIYISTL